MSQAPSEPVEAGLKRAALIFWDFDGVIKESVTVKAIAYERLFLPYGRVIAERVRQHHDANGGVSRYEKLPLYLEWAGEPSTVDQVHRFCDRFSTLVRQAVIDAPWVRGVREYLHAYHARQCFVLVTATPQDEIEQIVRACGIRHCFREVHGAPTPKAAAIRDALARWAHQGDSALVVGDSESDLAAAVANHLPFVLRCTENNSELRSRFRGVSFDQLSVVSGTRQG